MKLSKFFLLWVVGLSLLSLGFSLSADDTIPEGIENLTKRLNLEAENDPAQDIENLADQAIFFPVMENIEAGLWAEYKQSVSSRSWDLKYLLKVVSVETGGNYILEATTIRPYETVIQKWRVREKDGKILSYWIRPKNGREVRLPVLKGANNLELITIINPVEEKDPDSGERKWYNIDTNAGSRKCWRIYGQTATGLKAESFLAEEVPLFKIVRQSQDGMEIELLDFGQVSTASAKP